MKKVNLKYKGQQFVIEYHNKWFSKNKIMKIYEVMIDNYNTKNGFGCILIHQSKIKNEWFDMYAQNLFIYKEFLDKIYFSAPKPTKSVFDEECINLDTIPSPRRKIGFVITNSN